MHEEDEIRPRVVPLEGGQVNLDTASEFGLSFRDFPEIRESIRKYAVITVAAQMVLDEQERQRGGHGKRTVLMVRDTKELLVDGRPSVDVVYSTSVAMPLRHGTSSYTEHIQVPIETISGLVARLENGDIPFSPDPDRAVGFNQ